MTDGAYAEAARYCIRANAVTDTSCGFGPYIRAIPSHAVELASVYLDRNVAAVLARTDVTASPQQKQDVAAFIHLCGGGPATAFARRKFQMLCICPNMCRVESFCRGALLVLMSRASIACYCSGSQTIPLADITVVNIAGYRRDHEEAERCSQVSRPDPSASLLNYSSTWAKLRCCFERFDSRNGTALGWCTVSHQNYDRSWISTVVFLPTTRMLNRIKAVRRSGDQQFELRLIQMFGEGEPLSDIILGEPAPS
jgi:hypothetical protein